MSAVFLEKRGRRIEIRSRSTLPGIRTAVPGAYQTVAGYWTVPLSIESFKLLRSKYGDQLTIGSELRRWVKTVIQNRRYMRDLAKVEKTELVVVPRAAPKLYKAMRKRPYQTVGARFIAENPATLEADDPGLGKTLIALGGIIESQVPGPYLVVVAPKTAVRLVWAREIRRWLPSKHTVITLPEMRPQRERKLRLADYGSTTWLVVNPEIVLMQTFVTCAQCQKRSVVINTRKRQLPCKHMKTKACKLEYVPSFKRIFEIEWGAVIVDESHESLIVRQRSQLTQRRRGLEMLKIRPDGLRIAMSGTPFNSRPHHLWGTLSWLAPQQYPAFNRWAELFWQRGGYTGYEIGELRPDREKLLWDSLSAIALRRTKAEVAKDLPPKIEMGYKLIPDDESSPIGIWLDMYGAQAHAYSTMETASIADLESGKLEAVSALAELTRLKQLALSYGDIKQTVVRVHCRNSRLCTRFQLTGEPCRVGVHKELRDTFVPKLPSNKFDWLISQAEEWGYPSNPVSKVVVVSMYTSALRLFQSEFEKHFRTKPDSPLSTKLTGQTPERERLDIIDRFNNTDKHEHVLFLNIKAGGSSITIDSADRMVFLGRTRTPDREKQAEDRIHRVSNPRQCFYYYLHSLDTVDVGTAIANQDDIKATHRLLDGRRGVEYVRKIIDLGHRGG